MKHLRSATCLFGVCVVALCMASGCLGERRGTLTGKVTYKDKALPGGLVTFTTTGDAPQSQQATIQPDGTYSAPNLAYGTLKVSVLPGTKGGNQMPPGAKVPKEAPEQYTKAQTNTYVDIPDKYRTPDTSELKVDLDSSTKTYNIDLK